jgi:hypothetical protein
MTLLMLVALPLAIPTGAKADATLITAFTLTTSSNFRTPLAGETIFFPSYLISVASTTPSGLASKLRIRCEWKDVTNSRTYDEVYVNEGTFSPGEWQLTIVVSVTDSNYEIDYNNSFFSFSNDQTIGGKTFRLTGKSHSGVRYMTSFTVDETGVAPQFLKDTLSEKGYVDDPYEYQLTATGESPITYTKLSGTLPPGITLSSSGLLSGTFTAAGTYSFKVKATNRIGSDTLDCTYTVKNVTRITGFTLFAKSNFVTPAVGDAITFPSDKLSVTATIPAGNTAGVKIACEWREASSGRTYDEVNNTIGTFTEGEWQLTIVVSRTSDDYVFEIDNWDGITLGGKTFQMTGKATTGVRYRTTFHVGAATEPIDSVAVTITPPAIGQHPDYSPVLPEGAHYYMGNYSDSEYFNDVAWYDSESHLIPDAVFEDGETYLVRIFLTAEEGYEFTSSTRATVNGKTPIASGLFYGQFYVNYQFPKLVAAFDGTVGFDPADVQFKGSTPYVVYSGSPAAPGVIVKDAGGSVIDPSDYTVSYLENTQPGTGYAEVTMNATGAKTRAFFKIYMPPTTGTSVANADDGIKISWTAVPGAAGYVIYRRAWNLTSAGWTTFERWNNTTGTTWTDTKVYAGTRYQYGVKAYFAQRTDPVSGATIGGAMDNYNLGIVGPLKTTVRITTRTLNSVTGGTRQITAKWSGSKNFTGYQVQIATDTAFTKDLKTVTISDAKTVQTTIKSLKSGKTYYVRVRSYHVFEGTNYYGAWSNVMNARTK